MAKHTKHNPDYMKDKDADVVKHGSGPVIPQDHWEVNRDITPQGADNSWGAFLPRRAKDRPQPIARLNECDH